MKDVTEKNFGVIIAFLVPGFLLLWGLSYSSPEIDGWLAKSNAANAPTIGGFLYATLTSLALGLLISAFRYLIIDGFLHRVTGLNPEFDFTKLKDKDALAMFQAAVENHYRYYQYYSNTFVALVMAFPLYVVYARERPSCVVWIVFIVTLVVLAFASHDCLKKYYE